VGILGEVGSHMRIVLFYPRGSTYAGAARNVNHLACIMPPIGLASIAAVLRRSGHTVRICDAALSCIVTIDQWVSDILKWNPDIVGFSTITSNFQDAYSVCEAIKRSNPNVQTVFGGPHVSWGKDLILRRFEAIDRVIAGEGEYSFRALASGRPLSTIEGLYFRNGTLVENGPMPTRPLDMDALPFPAFDLLEGFPRKYLLPLFSYPRHPGAGIISSRGCLHQCSYCDRSVFGKSFRWNSPEYTVQQIAWLKRDFGVRHINFYDDQFTANRPRVQRLCELLLQKKEAVSFNCIVRLGHIDAHLSSLLKAAGCWMVSVGIESGDRGILDKNKNGLTIEAIRRDVRMLSDHGLYVKGLFMMGLPGETPDTIDTTRALAMELPLKDANMTAFTPFPGAPIAGIAAEGAVKDDDWSKMDCEHFVFVPKDIPSAAFLEERRALFYRSFYQRPFMRKIFAKMIFQSPHSYWRLLRHASVFLKYIRRMNSN
jgi:anaerobic magnesium-protoporphyrin IX monomethyl ester cyclase